MDLVQVTPFGFIMGKDHSLEIVVSIIVAKVRNFDGQHNMEEMICDAFGIPPKK